jgi:hypothetical protein
MSLATSRLGRSLKLVPQNKGAGRMPQQKQPPKVGERVGAWVLIERQADFVRSDQRVRTPVYRVQCVVCQKEIVLKLHEVVKRNCTDCQRNQPRAVVLSEAEIEQRIVYAYSVHRKICASLRIAPTSFATFSAELRADQSELIEASPLTTAADYELRDYTPLYSSTRE